MFILDDVLSFIFQSVLLPLMDTFLHFSWFKRIFYYIFNESMMACTKEHKGWTVVNHGFAYNKEVEDPVFLEIYPHAGEEGDIAPATLKDEKSLSQRYGLQLYHYLMNCCSQRLKTREKDIVEIGCGRGGGAHFLASHYEINSYVGIDVSSQNIHFCRTRHRNYTLSFLPARAEALPLKDRCCDVVLCVESAHEFSNFAEFLDESWRILRKDGFLVFCDYRSVDKTETLPDFFHSHGFVNVFESEITGNVLASLKGMQEQRVQAVKDSVPKWFVQPLTRYFACPDSPLYEDLRNRKLVYLTYILQKKGSLGTN